MTRFQLGLLALAVATSGLTGCAKVFAPQALSTNLALEPGVESNHPAFIDGDLKTDGETTFAVTGNQARRGGRATPPSEAVVLLPQPTSIIQITIHSDEIQGLDLYVEDPNQGSKFIDKWDNLQGPIINLRMKGIVYASGVTLRIRKGAGDVAARREAISTGVGGGQYISGETRAPVRIKEIEIFGPAPATAAADTISADDSEVGSIMMEDLSK